MPSAATQVFNKAHSNGSTMEDVQILVPVYNEGENVVTLYANLVRDAVSFERLCFIYDTDADTSLPYIEQLRQKDPRIVAEKNCYGRGVLNALKWGIAHSSDGPVIIVMGDNSDKLSLIPEMVELWRSGSSIVSPSRYTRGGKQIGGPRVKKTLSRVAGVSLALCGFPTSDPTNNFKLYDGAWLRSQTIESVGGFELALELTFKAYEQGKSIGQLPTVWTDRTSGQSNFQLRAWLPHYLRWYRRALLATLKNCFHL